MNDRLVDCFLENDRVWYRQTCIGGYGFNRDVPARYVRECRRRVTIDLLNAYGHQKRISVLRKNIRPRDKDVVMNVLDGRTVTI